MVKWHSHIVIVFALSLALLLGALETTVPAKAKRSPEFSLPIACEMGVTCFIQNYVDVDPGRGVTDYRCGRATYQGHKGTDFRLNSAAQSRTPVAVLAAAAGTVMRLRDGMADILTGDRNRASLLGRDCGNGVLIDHGSGWETQYCHMRKDSIAVRVGGKVTRGHHLGEVGYSGRAQFAHLHFSVRYNGVIIDPFSGQRQDATCNYEGRDAEALWDANARKVQHYSSGQVFGTGFTENIPDLNALERSHALPPVNLKSRQLIFFARFLSLREGDQIRLSVLGPNGFNIDNRTKPLRRDKATYVAYIGKRRKGSSWAPGRYDGRIEIIREGRTITKKEVVLNLAE